MKSDEFGPDYLMAEHLLGPVAAQEYLRYLEGNDDSV